MIATVRAYLDSLEKVAELLTYAFYALLFLAFVVAVVGSPGAGLLLLILGSATHVARVGVEDLARERPAPRARPTRRA
jgi:hypothetical protein